MLKVTLIFSLLFFISCREPHSNEDIYKFEKELNKDAEARIDAAYRSIQKHCDSAIIYEMPHKVDSIIKSRKVK